jgi:hypothetical protein
MGTRSTIALEFADGTVGQVYCHWDGYLSHNGKILSENYTDPFKLRDLIDLGDLSSLGKEIGVKHEFDNPHRYDAPEYLVWQEAKKGMCTFYMRDRGEEGVEARSFKDFDDYMKNHDCQEYEYILRTDGVWYVCQDGEKYEPLIEAIVEEMRLATEEE